MDTPLLPPEPADMERVLGLRKPNLPWEKLDEQRLAILRGE